MNLSGAENTRLRYDYILIAVVLLLTLFGLVTLYSASYLFAMNQPRRFTSGWTPLVGNLTSCVLMIAMFPILSLIRLDWLKQGGIIFALVVITFALNFLPFLKPFQRSGYARRWIILGNGIGFQPSELIKIVLPLYLAYILNKNREKLQSFVYGPLPPLLVTAGYCTVVLMQSNFSDAVLIALTGILICFIAGIRLRWFVLALLIIIPVGYRFTVGDPRGIGYQRIQHFLSREASPPDMKTQIDFSIDAIQSGGFWGKGIGQGTLKVRMPEVHGDFIFASFVEESGFLGVILYFVLVGIFASICYITAWRSKNTFTQLLAFGLVTPVIIQTLLNIAVVANIIPTTGVPLPFISSGGSSLLVTLAGSALLVNITRRSINDDDEGVRYAG